MKRNSGISTKMIRIHHFMTLDADFPGWLNECLVWQKNLEIIIHVNQICNNFPHPLGILIHYVKFNGSATKACVSKECYNRHFLYLWPTSAAKQWGKRLMFQWLNEPIHLQILPQLTVCRGNTNAQCSLHFNALWNWGYTYVPPAQLKFLLMFVKEMNKLGGDKEKVQFIS